MTRNSPDCRYHSTIGCGDKWPSESDNRSGVLLKKQSLGASLFIKARTRVAWKKETIDFDGRIGRVCSWFKVQSPLEVKVVRYHKACLRCLEHAIIVRTARGLPLLLLWACQHGLLCPCSMISTESLDKHVWGPILLSMVQTTLRF